MSSVKTKGSDHIDLLYQFDYIIGLKRSDKYLIIGIKTIKFFDKFTTFGFVYPEGTLSLSI